jgi:hypothetical protein
VPVVGHHIEIVVKSTRLEYCVHSKLNLFFKVRLINHNNWVKSTDFDQMDGNVSIFFGFFNLS